MLKHELRNMKNKVLMKDYWLWNCSIPFRYKR